MTTQNNSKELRVIDAAYIEEDLKKFGGIEVAGVTVSFDDKILEAGQTGAAGSTSDGAVSGVKVEFGEGKVTNTKILIPIQNAMSVPAPELDEKRKAAIEKRAEASKEEKSRDGIGE